MLRLKQAEWALRMGRLDEALRDAVREDFRAHRRGKELVGRLTGALVLRAREHLQAQRVQAAAEDCQRAMRIAADHADVVALWQTIQEELVQQTRLARAEGAALREARKWMARGDWTIGRELVEKYPESPQASELMGQMEIQQREVERIRERVQAAIDQQSIDDALRWLVQLRQLRPDYAEVSRLARGVSQQLVTQVREHLQQGRLDQCVACLTKTAAVRDLMASELQSLFDVTERLQLASRAIRDGRISDVIDTLVLVSQCLPGIAWLDEALLLAREVADRQTRLAQGPLGLLNLSTHSQPIPFRRGVLGETQAFPAPTRPTEANIHRFESSMEGQMFVSTHHPFVMHVDGAGAIQVLPQRELVLGPASSSVAADLRLLGFPPENRVKIERRDGDYFLHAEPSIEVNGRNTSGKLLADGDQLVIGRRCRIRFRLPVATSTTAVLVLEGAQLATGHAKAVVLLDDAIVLGAGPKAHVPLMRGNGRAVLFANNHQLVLRTDSATLPVQFNQPIVTEVVSMTLRPVTTTV